MIMSLKQENKIKPRIKLNHNIVTGGAGVKLVIIILGSVLLVLHLIKSQLVRKILCIVLSVVSSTVT